MGRLNYETLFQEVHALFNKKKLKEAYDLLTTNRNIEGGVLPRIYYNRFYLAVSIGRKELGLKILREALIDNGFWYPDNFYLDPDLDILHSDGEFDKLLKISKKNELEALDNSELRIKTVLPSKEYLKHPKLMFHIHGKAINMNYKQFMNYMDPIFHVDSLKEYITCMPISSISSYAGCPDWSDISRGVTEIKHHLDNIVNQYKIKNEDIIIVGSSYGATVTLEGFINGIFDTKNVVFMEPYIEKFEESIEDMKIFAEKDMSVYVFCGDKDDFCFPIAKSLSQKLDALNVRSKFTIEKGLGHGFPSNFSEIMKNMADFFN